MRPVAVLAASRAALSLGGSCISGGGVRVATAPSPAPLRPSGGPPIVLHPHQDVAREVPLKHGHGVECKIRVRGCCGGMQGAAGPDGQVDVVGAP